MFLVLLAYPEPPGPALNKGMVRDVMSINDRGHMSTVSEAHEILRPVTFALGTIAR